MNVKKIIFVLLLICTYQFAIAQSFTQTIRGTVSDKILQKPIAGATIRITDLNIGDATDPEGIFRISQIPIGTHTILISALGYKDQTLNNITLNTGKELVLSVFLEEKIIEGKEIRIKSTRKKNIPLNEMSIVSARSFTIEETQKYAAAVNDPSRMASNFAGVMMNDDGNNNIVIRGNSPSGLLWRMEGVDIPNPNHFAVPGSSGGGISILSTQLLANSDFVTGAFAAEYGNALSGVFDLKLRKGNNSKREYTIQAGVLGLNVAAEGPIMPLYKGSYLINYRYSTLSILSKTKILQLPSTTNFQDLSYHFYLPTNKYGIFSLFSFAGLSDQFYNVKKDSSLWKNEDDKYGDKFVSNTGAWGATHSIHAGKNNLIKTALVYAATNVTYKRDYTLDDYSSLNVANQKNAMQKITLSSSINKKINSRLMWRSGIIATHIRFNYFEKIREDHTQPLKELVNTKANTQTLQGYSQMQYTLNDQFTFNAGFHSLLLLLNGKTSFEPRASIRWNVHAKHNLSFAYGNHSQLQGWGIYFAQVQTNNDFTQPNKNLGFSKAHHFVLSHQWSMQTNLRLKTELYYQHLYNIPISASDTNTFSVINSQYDYMRDPLVNNGKGKNYGMEISLEKYLSNNFYYMLCVSLYESKYTAANGKQYNSKFNGNSIYNIIGGKEFVSKNQRRTFGINLKALYAGGYRTTPINFTQSIAQQETVYIDDKAYSEKLPSYYRGDLRISIKWNRKRLTSTLSLDLQNFTNRLNVYDRFYDVSTQQVKTYYQTGIIPILNYKVEF